MASTTSHSHCYYYGVTYEQGFDFKLNLQELTIQHYPSDSIVSANWINSLHYLNLLFSRNSVANVQLI